MQTRLCGKSPRESLSLLIMIGSLLKMRVRGGHYQYWRLSVVRGESERSESEGSMIVIRHCSNGCLQDKGRSGPPRLVPPRRETPNASQCHTGSSPMLGLSSEGGGRTCLRHTWQHSEAGTGHPLPFRMHAVLHLPHTYAPSRPAQSSGSGY